MKAVIQRVTRASVEVDGRTIGAIGRGLVVLLGVAEGDGVDEARRLAQKTAEMRIFEDTDGRFNLSLLDVAGEALVVSQFTLLADTRRGRRPSFTDAAPPEAAESLVREFEETLRGLGVPVASGRFRAHMQVDLVNDGPVTIILDTADLQRPRRG
ncbi:MAG TPA: D-aminoacyl-tRNA deacylase [Dehalococcoidia bacterium]|nr:D-aminoacyl-tRNA deacylase [Dehalococcoidia bacterium]